MHILIFFLSQKQQNIYVTWSTIYKTWTSIQTASILAYIFAFNDSSGSIKQLNMNHLLHWEEEKTKLRGDI